MTTKERIMIKATRLGFVSKDKLVSVNDDYYPMWLFELNRWMAMTFGMTVTVECLSPSGFFATVSYRGFSDDELSGEVREEDVFQSYDLCYEDSTFWALDYLNDRIK